MNHVIWWSCTSTNMETPYLYSIYQKKKKMEEANYLTSMISLCRGTAQIVFIGEDVTSLWLLHTLVEVKLHHLCAWSRRRLCQPSESHKGKSSPFHGVNGISVLDMAMFMLIINVHSELNLLLSLSKFINVSKRVLPSTVPSPLAITFFLQLFCDEDITFKA